MAGKKFEKIFQIFGTSKGFFVEMLTLRPSQLIMQWNDPFPFDLLLAACGAKQ